MEKYPLSADPTKTDSLCPAGPVVCWSCLLISNHSGPSLNTYLSIIGEYVESCVLDLQLVMCTLLGFSDMVTPKGHRSTFLKTFRTPAMNGERV